jgi:hypothetical protein
VDGYLRRIGVEPFDTRTGLGGVEIWIALEDAGS